MVCFCITIVKHLGQWLLYYVCYIDFARTMHFNDKAQHISHIFIAVSIFGVLPVFF